MRTIDILAIISNPIAQTVGSALFGLFAGSVSIWFYVKTGLSEKIISSGDNVGNSVALFVYYNALKPIKDTKLREKLTADLDTAGDDFNLGWDKGLRGEKI